MKYSERLVDKIVKLIEEDRYTITEICRAFKLNTKTFYEWKKTKPEFRKAIEEAE
ncbi:transposase-like protein, partial [Dysgonomonas hofstadii]